MKPEIKKFQHFVIDLHLFTPVVRLAIFPEANLQIASCSGYILVSVIKLYEKRYIYSYL